jgi:hypothetical protein
VFGTKSQTHGSWTRLDSQAAADSLLTLTAGFHDSCVHEIHISTGRYVGAFSSMSLMGNHDIHLLIQTQGEPSALELRFVDVVSFGFARPDSDGVILDASLFLRDGVVYWADQTDFQPGFPRAETTWVAARGAFWREVSSWTGSTLRYRPADAPA